MADVKKETMKMEYPHVQAAFINAIREEGTKDEACDWLQKTWNELCALRATLRQPDTSEGGGEAVGSIYGEFTPISINAPLNKSPNPEHVEGDVLSVGEMEAVAWKHNLTSLIRYDKPNNYDLAQGDYEPLVTLSAAQSSIQRVEAERDEARDSSHNWHRQCGAIATILELHEPECLGFAGEVRSKFDRLKAQLEEARKVLADAFDFLGGVDGAVEIREAILPFIASIGEKQDAE